MVKLSDVIPQKYFIYIPDRIFLRLLYIQKRKKLLNTRNPKTYSEKIAWVKMYGHLEDYTLYADKFAVREYVKRIIGEKYLVPMIGSWESVDDIPIAKLPKKFVIKTNHGAGYNYICKDKSKLDVEDMKSSLNQWLGESFYEFFRESQYKNIKPRIICEKYIEDEFGELRDYKFMCVKGKVKMIEVHHDRMVDHKVATLDPNWKRMPFDLKDIDSGSAQPVSRPKNTDEMIRIAEKLSKNLPYVRVDLYSVRGKVYFGELSFTPAEGLPYLGETDIKMGKILDISGFKKRHHAPKFSKS